MNKKQLLTALEKAVMLDEGSLTPETKLTDVDGFDSMAVLEFQALADEEFHMQVDPTLIANCKTVDDLCKLVEEKLED